MSAAAYPDPHRRGVAVFRWVVFGAAGFYAIYMVTTADYSFPGGPFRHLTIWALLLSFWSASRMLAFSERRVLRYHTTLPAVAAVMNAMVVYLYWSLWFRDPALVQSRGPIVWWQEYYLHLAGPLLQWIDALWLRRAFGRPLKAAAVLIGIVVVYVVWVEGFVGPLNTAPVGEVTAGLPYPFLNNMTLPERLTYYATVSVGALIVLVAFTALGWLVTRVAPPRA